eukprot:CAMPEP_0117687166 /NCGR_PEP_ID=MMETSP0804-20121206/22964_1 /TAXON_ID=1074897 /ORGANISM="Tetraselmis astigmatica, Strain CCMP880" /LENGTH=113 /DNA_ID=CAMNT_0005499159 /DNA_START=139 /DNA_END=481 /DNA_ORIENTATION=-
MPTSESSGSQAAVDQNAPPSRALAEEVGDIACTDAGESHTPFDCPDRLHDGVVVGHGKVANGEPVICAIHHPMLCRPKRSSRPAVEQVPHVHHEPPADNRHSLPDAVGVVENL